MAKRTAKTNHKSKNRQLMNKSNGKQQSRQAISSAIQFHTFKKGNSFLRALTFYFVIEIDYNYN